MAFGDVINGLKKKVDRYLYGEEAQPQQGFRPEDNYAPAPDAAFSQQPAAYTQNQYYQQPQQPMGYQQAMNYQPQQPQPAVQPVSQPQPQQPQRSLWNRQEKVLNIKDYQPQEVQQPEEEKPAQQATCRVVCARGMMDCRMAITLLRAGDSVLVTMENVKDPAEMRRLVDTLSGACYSLNASITKVSRYGVYLLAPQSMLVFADQMINQMNGAAPRAQRPQMTAQQLQAAPQRPVYTPQQQAEFGRQPVQNPYMPQENYAAPQTHQAQMPYQQPNQDVFTQRMAAPQESAGAFYARPQQQPAQMPAFSSQSANSGYVPDDMEVAE